MSEDEKQLDEVAMQETPAKKKATEPARYLAIYKTVDSDAEGCIHYVTAKNGTMLRKLLDNVPVENILTIWKGREKEVYLKSVVTF